MAVLLAIACGHVGDHAGAHGDTGERDARIDSSGPRGAVEGVDTRSTVSARPSTAADSAAVLDRAYQAVRTTINTEAHALDTLPAAARRTAAYAQRFDALRRETLHADSLRAARDRERAKARQEVSH